MQRTANSASGEAAVPALPQDPAPGPRRRGEARAGLPRGGHDTVSHSRLLASLLTFASLLCLVLTFASIVHGERSADHSRHMLLKAADQKLLVQQMVTAARQAAMAQEASFERLTSLRERFDRLQQQLIRDMNIDTLALPASVNAASATAEAAWQQMREDVARIEGARADILQFRELALSTRRQLHELEGASLRAAELLTQAGAPPRSVLDAGLQLARIGAMVQALNDLHSGGSTPPNAVATVTAVADEFEVTLGSLRSADDDAGANGQRAAVRAALDETRLLYREMRDNAEAVLALLPAVTPALAADERLRADDQAVEQALDELMVALREDAQHPKLGGLAVGTDTALLSGALAMLFLGLLGVQQLMLSRRRERTSQAQNQANEAAIGRLLDEIGELADGDLTVRATVAEDITGAIADSINYAVQALRELVKTINGTSARINDSAQRTRQAATRLARGSQTQADQIELASDSITAMTDAIEEMARNAAESAAVASRAVLVAGRGAQAVRDTIDGMGKISGPIQETSRRIKRLGSSSEEIGEIVELIDDIADQTNILALNAAMQAAMAGEAGRGFAVVADEVQRLAERSSSATKQIEAIVRTIRSDTGEAVRSMETSIAGLATGTKVAENAGTALREIENVSNYIADLTRRIADSAGNESRAAVKVNETVKSIRAITQENTQGTRATAESVEALALLADELQHSVAGFRLPREQ